MFKRVINEELKIPAEVDYLGDLRDFVTKVGRKYGVSETEINAFKLAIDEAGTNIIRHAYRDWQGFITLRMVVRDQSVTVSLIDQGHTFDPRKVKDPDLQRYVDIGKKGGLGIFIMRKVIDEIDYRKTEEGNELRLTKLRENTRRHRLMVPEVSVNMKTKFFLIATSVLSPVVIALFFWNFSQVGKTILRADLAEGWALTRSATQRSLDLLESEATWDLTTLAAEFHQNHAPKIWDVVIVDTAGLIQGTNRMDLLLRPFFQPGNRIQMGGGVTLYALPEDGRQVYDLANPALQRGQGRRLGTVHVLMDKGYIDNAIAARKRKLLLNFGLMFLLGNLGVAILIYITMSPFRKLASWVKDLGQGGSPDNMDFDDSDEIGEIAKAFNEITEKFRKSQENLAEQERLQKEMQVAQEIQQTLLPDTFPDIEGYELASYYAAAKEVGGDYYDFVEVDKDTLGIVVADVSGKGVPGSLIMTMIRTALRTEARGNKNAADVLARVNDFVINDMKRGMFVTVFYIILDSKNRTINYASAGHNPMILYRGSTQKSYYLNPRGFPIGISLPEKDLFRKSIESDTLRLRRDDVLLVFTDGITEAMNKDRSLFGDERFLEAIRTHGHQKAETLVERIHNELDLFTEESPQNDDITLVAIREKLSSEDVLYNLRSRLMHMVQSEGMSVKAACEAVGVSTSTYYKYKKRFEKEGEEGLKEKVGRTEIDERHISIEDKAKIFDIIKKNPELGAKRISEELATEAYGFTELDASRIYDELVRSRLNTKELRQAFVERGERRRYKQPGTPLLTLDGQVIKADRPTLRPFRSEEPPEAVETALIESQVAAPLEPVDAAEAAEMDSLLDDDFLGLVEMEGEELDQPLRMDEAFGESEEVAGEGVEAEEVESGESEDFDGLLEMELDGFEETARPFEAVLDASVDDFEALDAAGEELEWEDLLADVEEVSTTDEESALPEHLASVRLDEVLAIDEDAFADIEGDAHIEDKIASSSLDDLMGEVLGDEERPARKAPQENEAGFIEMMEDLGFDRRNMLSGGEAFAEETLVTAQPLMDAERIFQGGMNYYKAGQFRQAIGEFERVLEINPRDGSAYQCLGDAFFRLGEMESARSAYEEARLLLPQNVNVLENLGVIFANMGEYKKAVWQWGEVLKQHPERKDIIERIKKMQRVIRQRYL